MVKRVHEGALGRQGWRTRNGLYNHSALESTTLTVSSFLKDTNISDSRCLVGYFAFHALFSEVVTCSMKGFYTFFADGIFCPLLFNSQNVTEAMGKPYNLLRGLRGGGSCLFPISHDALFTASCSQRGLKHLFSHLDHLQLSPCCSARCKGSKKEH